MDMKKQNTVWGLAQTYLIVVPSIHQNIYKHIHA